MRLKTKVKVGNITNLSDARYCAGMGVDLLGFPIGNSEGEISIETFKEIAEWVAGPEFILELSDTIDHALLQKVTQMESIKHIQLNMDQFKSLGSSQQGKSLIVLTNLNEWKLRHNELKKETIAYLIIEDKKLIWDEIEVINKAIPVIVPHSHLPADTDPSQFPIAGIALEGTNEDKPGQKDYDHLAEVLEMLEVD